MSTIIQTTRLTKSYGRSRGIIDVTFAIQEGEVFGFLGPNGAGKTTTMRTLMGHPVFLGVNWTNFLGMTGVALVLLLIGLIQFRFADVTRG